MRLISLLENIDHKRAYRYRSMRWALCNEDFSDLTVSQIAEVFNTSYDSVIKAIGDIKKKTGFTVQYIRKRKEGEE